MQLRMSHMPMMKSGRSRAPRCCVSARFLGRQKQPTSHSSDIPDLAKLVIVELALQEDVAGLVAGHEAVLGATSDEDTGELRAILGGEGSQRLLARCGRRQWRRGRGAVGWGVWVAVERREWRGVVRERSLDVGLAALLQPADESSSPVPAVASEEAVVVGIGDGPDLA
jgi:hypothetical protein